MKDEISSVDLHFLVKELSILENAKIDKVYESDYLLIGLHVPNQGRKFLKITGKLLYLLQDKEDMPEQPSLFAIALRKRLNNARIRKIVQPGLERILLLELTTKDKNYKLVFEFFDGGNIILLDENSKIDLVKKQIIFQNREIKKGKEYLIQDKTFPGEKEFCKAMLASTKNVSKALATDLSLGGFYAGELCLRAGIDKNAEPDDKNTKELFKQYVLLFEQELEPFTIQEQAYPVKLDAVKGADKEFSSFSQAIASLFEQAKEQKTPKKNKEIEKVEKMIAMQEKTVKDLLKKSEDHKRRGELVYEYYQLIDNIIKELNKARENLSWKEIKEKLKGHKIIKDIDEKEKRIKIEL